MDAIFHGASAALLARALGERRPTRLWVAAGIGILPDLIALGGRMSGVRLYPLAHSLLLQLLIVLLAAPLNWRVAFGSVAHVLLDVPAHRYATAYLLFPFARWQAPIGLSWYRGAGWLLWALLWTGVLAGAWITVRRRQTAGVQPGHAPAPRPPLTTPGPPATP